MAEPREPWRSLLVALQAPRSPFDRRRGAPGDVLTRVLADASDRDLLDALATIELALAAVRRDALVEHANG